MFDLDEERPAALITGASSGIGRAFAEKLGRRGYDLVLVARRRERLEALAGELRDGREIQVETITADLANPRDLEQVTSRIDSGSFSLVVNNAGFGAYGEFTELERRRQLEMIDVNVRALTAIAHAALQAMKAAGTGTLINVGASSGFQPGPYVATYAATKAYVLSLSEALHEEAHAHGVTVTCVCPGWCAPSSRKWLASTPRTGRT
ncbi:MAG: SDR family oxidoreductase [Dehalococcoidia bacterium]|nr:SDR family oxidoreductase [Dehalococcoidia bacterium]